MDNNRPPERQYTMTPEEREAFEKENTALSAYRKIMKEDLRQVFREEMGTYSHIKHTVDSLHMQNLPFKTRWGILYIAPVSGIVAFGLIIVKIIADLIK
jgi:hypothetical protein